MCKQEKMANDKRSQIKSGNQFSVYLAGYFYPGLLFSGLMIFSGEILFHTLRQGASLSTIGKIGYLLFTFIAGIFLLGGIWARTQVGIRSIAKFIKVPESSIFETRQTKIFRILESALIVGSFITIFIFSVDTKIAVYNLDAARSFNDTPRYVSTGSYSLLDGNFWVGKRPFTIPLFYKLIGYTPQNYSDQGEMEQVARIQLIFSIIAWTILAISVTLLMRRMVFKFISFAVITMVGATLYVTQWDRLMLSESLSTSLFVLLLAFLVVSVMLWIKDLPQPPWFQILFVFCLIVIATLYCFTRDINAYFLLSLGGLMVLGSMFNAVFRHRLFAEYVFILMSFLTLFGISNAIVNLNTRYAGPLRNVLVYRFFPDEEKLSYLRQKGLPYNPRFSTYYQLTTKEYGKLLSIDDPEGLLDTWISKYGKKILVVYLLSHLDYALIDPLIDQSLTNGNFGEFRKILSPTPFRLSFLTGFFYPRFPIIPIFFVLFFGISIFLAWKDRPHRIWMIVILALFLTAIPSLLLIWHSDTSDIPRHSLQAALQLRLASWLCSLSLMERGWMVILDIWKKGRAKVSPAEIFQS
jgi:hypothetical protein